MNKKTFLKTMKTALKNHPDSSEIINYYDELIEEAKLNGEDEEVVVKRLGSVEAIVSSLDQSPKGTFATKNPPVKKNPSFIAILIGNVLLIALSVVGFAAVTGFMLGGWTSLFISVYRLFTTKEFIISIYYVSQIILAIGIILICLYILISIINNIKKIVAFLLSKQITKKEVI